MTRKWLAACRIALLPATLALSGCATYSDSFGIVQHSLAKNDYDAALKAIDKQAAAENSKVLHWLNKGMVLRMRRDFTRSNVALEAAKDEMERLYAVSVSENALSFIVNDATVSYAGDDYEQVLVHLYMALNYLELGQLVDARVEALQLDIKLREIGERIPDNKFTEDAMSRYLTGMIYEELGEWSDAMIAYRKAYDAYKKYKEYYGLDVPDMLGHDLVRLAKRQGLKREERKYRKEFRIESSSDEVLLTSGELVFVLNNGLAPIKREKIVGASGPHPGHVADMTAGRNIRSARPVLVNIALPYYESRRNEVLKARIAVSGIQTNTQMVEDVDAIARASLEARMPAITARSIARAISKATIQEAVDRSGRNGDNDLAVELLGSFVVRVAALATERADTRSWLTLPANVQLARVALPAGRYSVVVELLGEGDKIIATREYEDVTISEKHKTYLSSHWIPDVSQRR